MIAEIKKSNRRIGTLIQGNNLVDKDKENMRKEQRDLEDQSWRSRIQLIVVPVRKQREGDY